MWLQKVEGMWQHQSKDTELTKKTAGIKINQQENDDCSCEDGTKDKRKRKGQKLQLRFNKTNREKLMAAPLSMQQMSCE